MIGEQHVVTGQCLCCWDLPHLSVSVVTNVLPLMEHVLVAPSTSQMVCLAPEVAANGSEVPALGTNCSQKLIIVRNNYQLLLLRLDWIGFGGTSRELQTS